MHSPHRPQTHTRPFASRDQKENWIDRLLTHLTTTLITVGTLLLTLPGLTEKPHTDTPKVLLTCQKALASPWLWGLLCMWLMTMLIHEHQRHPLQKQHPDLPRHLPLQALTVLFCHALITTLVLLNR